LITNKKFSINVHDNFAFEISRQGKFRFAKGQALFSKDRGVADGFKQLNDEPISTRLGTGQRFAFTGRRGDIVIRLDIDVYKHLPDSVVMQWSFENTGSSTIELNPVSAPALELDSAWAHELWTMQGAAVHWGQDFAFKLPAKLERENYLGHVQKGEAVVFPLSTSGIKTLG